MSISFQVEGVRIGSGHLFLIAGPCVIESEKHALFMAEVIKGITRSLNIPFIFKASYDKANRTSMRSFRGPGLGPRSVLGDQDLEQEELGAEALGHLRGPVDRPAGAVRAIGGDHDPLHGTNLQGRPETTRG